MSHTISAFDRPAERPPATARKQRTRFDHRASLRMSALTIIGVSVVLWMGVIEIVRHLPI